MNDKKENNPPKPPLDDKTYRPMCMRFEPSSLAVLAFLTIAIMYALFGSPF